MGLYHHTSVNTQHPGVPGYVDIVGTHPLTRLPAYYTYGDAFNAWYQFSYQQVEGVPGPNDYIPLDIRDWEPDGTIDTIYFDTNREIWDFEAFANQPGGYPIYLGNVNVFGWSPECANDLMLPFVLTWVPEPGTALLVALGEYTRAWHGGLLVRLDVGAALVRGRSVRLFALLLCRRRGLSVDHCARRRR